MVHDCHRTARSREEVEEIEGLKQLPASHAPLGQGKPGGKRKAARLRQAAASRAILPHDPTPSRSAKRGFWFLPPSLHSGPEYGKNLPDLRRGFSFFSDAEEAQPRIPSGTLRVLKIVPVLASPSVAATPSRQGRVVAFSSSPWVSRSTPSIHLAGKGAPAALLRGARRSKLAEKGRQEGSNSRTTTV